MSGSGTSRLCRAQALVSAVGALRTIRVDTRHVAESSLLRFTPGAYSGRSSVANKWNNGAFKIPMLGIKIASS